MPPSRRRKPPSPPPPRLARLPPLNLAPVRPPGSVKLDTATTKNGEPMPPFVRWDRFLDQWIWKQGEHVTTIGPTGSGKTVLNRALLARRRFVVVLGVKNRDEELYGPFEKQGYELQSRFDPEPPADAPHSRVLFVPRADGYHGVEANRRKSKAFRNVLNEIMDIGFWTVYADDIQWMADELRLSPEFREMWMLGRSEKISVVASSQEPVDIPVMAYGMATHLFLFKNADLYRARRMAELTGINREIAQYTIMNLDRHEFLYIHKDTGRMVRSIVLR